LQTLVSQDASLFSGSLRDNLDPLEEHTDAECWDVLERIHLKQLLERGTKEAISLDMPVSQNSLSAGEKQLLALARAILRRTNVIILDESTAQVDQALDDKVYVTILIILHFT
jgi:ABC-type multidrug transport system fused ATPase/permease subunit